MNRLVLIGIGWLISCFSLKADGLLRFVMDHNGKLYAIPTEKKYEWKIPQEVYKSYIPISEQNRLLGQKYMEFYQRYSEEITNEAHSVALLNLPESDRPANMHTLSEAYRPFFHPYTAMLRRMNPMALDYDELYIHPMSENSLFWANGIQESWPGLGGINVIQTSFTQTFGKVSISAGGFGGRYYTPYTDSPSLWGGLNIMTHYQMNDWMALKAWGSYAFYGKNSADPFMNLNPMLNRTNVGGALEIKVTDNFKLGFGINYQYDQMNHRMNRQFLFSPFGTRGRNSFHMGF